MKIQRRFTQPGIDPLDTIEWEKRESVIREPDGTVVFEMRDIEVPKSWSQVATDILAQKYFRKAGVPQPDGSLGRETSARQLVRRLAGCWTDWGRRYGYFDSADDASAFDAEITHMLINQMSSPNSPQWFNTGLNYAYGINGPAQGHYYVDPDSKDLVQSKDAYTHPQPHACFIQSVDDDLVNDNGIMDLWVREARLFKYGSGCISEKAFVPIVGRGLVRIGDLFNEVSRKRPVVNFDGKGRYVSVTDLNLRTLSLDRETGAIVEDPIDFVWSYDVRLEDKLTVRFDTGARATVSAWHPFMVWDGNDIVERRADQLMRGDAVIGPNATAEEVMDSASGSRILSYAVPWFRRSKLHAVVADEEIAWLIGYFLGDGSLGYRKQSVNRNGRHYEYRSLRLRFFDEDREPLQRVARILRDRFGASSSISLDPRGKCLILTCVQASACGFFAEFVHAPGIKGATLKVPEFVKRGPSGLQIAFLSGLVDSDGHVSGSRALYTSESREFVEEVAAMASLHGLGGGIHKDDTVWTTTVLRRSASAQSMERLAGHLARPKHVHALRSSERGKRRQFCLPLSEEIGRRVFAERDDSGLHGFAGGESFHLGRLTYEGIVNPHKLATAVALRAAETKTDSELRRLSLIAEGVAFVSEVCACTEDIAFNDLTTRITNTYLAGESGLVVIHNTGTNFSNLRAEGEKLSGGGTSSGLMSFLRVGDRAAGAIKSGGTTRRAAKMVILDMDHPDIEKFINWKVQEEKKVAALMAAGYDGSYEGDAYQTVSGQNSNNSVRIPDSFIDAVRKDGSWDLLWRKTPGVARTVRARDLWDQVGRAAWACADPGVQYDDIINSWHTCPAGGRIRASNPCVTGETLVATASGWQRIDELVGKSAAIIGCDGKSHYVRHIFPTGCKPVFRVRTQSGYEVRITADHKILTKDRGDVAVKDIRLGERIQLGFAGFGAKTLPEHIALGIGLSVGDGYLGRARIRNRTQESIILATAREEAPILEKVAEAVNDYTFTNKLPGTPGRLGGVSVSLTVGSVSRLSFGSSSVVGLFKEYAVLDEGSHRKRFTNSIFDLGRASLAAVLRGLFTADGTVANYADKSQYVSLDSSSVGLLKQVQLLLLSFGVKSKLYSGRRCGITQASLPDGKGGIKSYPVREMYSLRISRSSRLLFEQNVGFDSNSAKHDALAALNAQVETYRDDMSDAVVSVEADGEEDVFDLTEPDTNHFIANGLVVHNCSEYMFLDDTACNLASINLMKFFDAERSQIDVDGYKHAVRLWTVVLEISVLMAQFPSQEIARKSYEYRTLGLGYANLGTLLMVAGIPYDSPRALAITGALSAILTGESYAASAEMASQVGPFPKHHENAEHMLRVMRNHRRAAYNAPASEYEEVSVVPMGIDQSLCPPYLLAAARECWDRALELGEEHGYRNAQATCIAPTGCLVGGSLVITDRGLMRLNRLGDVNGAKWQETRFGVYTDEGERSATKFYVNGVEPTRRIKTTNGYAIQGTPAHRIKVVNPETGQLEWKRFAEVMPGDVAALSMGRLAGSPNAVNLPPLGEEYSTGDYTTKVPRQMSESLAELVGYCMGDGSFHSKGLRFWVSASDTDVVRWLQETVKQLFNLEVSVIPKTGYVEVAVHSVPLTIWWEACGFTKLQPHKNHSGTGYSPRIPEAVMATNDPFIYGGFLRGLYEADGTVTAGVPCWSTVNEEFSADVKTMMLTLGLPTTTAHTMSGWGNSTMYVLRLRNKSYVKRFEDAVGFISARKSWAVEYSDEPQAARRDYIHLPASVIDKAAPQGHALRDAVKMSARRNRGAISRRSALALADQPGNSHLRSALDFFYDTVDSNEDGGEQLTYDISVPENLTYIANGFISHNTIGLQMDCDTTGIEPDFALVKFKKLSGGGYFKIINQSIPAALRNFSYTQAQIDDIIRYAKGSGSLYGAPYINHETLRARGLNDEDLQNIEKALPTVFELGFAFNHWALGEPTLQRLGFKPEQYTAVGFDLVRELGFSRDEVDAANDYICGTMTIEGAPHLKEEHYAAFDCANKCGKKGKRFIHHMGHVRMMAAAQPFISGSISKTINLPNEATIADIEEAYMRSWDLGLKSIALYRDGSKLSQPLSNKGTDNTSDKAADDRQLALSPELEEQLAAARKARAEELGPDEILAAAKRILANATNTDFKRKVAQALERNRLPAKRRGWTQKAKIAGHTVFLRTGEYADGTLGEIFVDLHKEGASFRSLMNCFAIAVSIGLQYGVPLEEFVEKFTFTRFEPNGFVDHPNVKYCTSVIDYIFRVLGMEYLGRTDFVQVKPEDRDVDDPHHEDHAQNEFDALVAAQQVADEPKPSPMKRVVPAAEPAQPKLAQNVEPGLAQQLNALRSQQAQLASMMGDAPLCDTCGSLTRRNGACYVCDSCGRSMGCS